MGACLNKHNVGQSNCTFYFCVNVVSQGHRQSDSYSHQWYLSITSHVMAGYEPSCDIDYRTTTIAINNVYILLIYYFLYLSLFQCIICFMFCFVLELEEAYFPYTNSNYEPLYQGNIAPIGFNLLVNIRKTLTVESNYLEV